MLKSQRNVFGDRDRDLILNLPTFQPGDELMNPDGSVGGVFQII